MKRLLLFLFFCIFCVIVYAGGTRTIKVGGSTTLSPSISGTLSGVVTWYYDDGLLSWVAPHPSPYRSITYKAKESCTTGTVVTAYWDTQSYDSKGWLVLTSHSESWTIYIQPNEPTSISLNNTSVSLQVGDTKQLSATVSPSGTSQNVTWSVTSGSTYASVSSSGLVTAKAAGTATIRATSTAKNSVYKDCTVYVSEAVSPTSVSLNYTSLSLLEGATKQLTANVLPSDALQDVTWSVTSGSTYASVSSSGLVTAKAAGTATIRATSTANSSIYRNCTVTVTAQALTPGTWSGNTLTIGGDATSSVHEVPFGNFYHYSTSQLIYTPTEIGKSGTINSIAFKVANSNSFSTNEVKVYLGHKSGKFSSTSNYVSSSNLTLVYSGSPTLGQTTGWETLTFNQGSFTYNGTDNLVVVVTKEADSYTSSLNYYCYSGSGYALYRHSDSASDYASVSNTSYPYTLSTNRPSVRLGFAASPTSVSLNYTSISMEVGDSKQLSATVYPSGVSQNVTWSVTSGSGVVSVSSSGIITALAVGTATVRATSASNNSIYKNCTVTVKEKEHNYYYVGSQNDWQIGNKSYPFTKLGDGITWELTMSAADSDDFVIGIDDVDDWTSSDDVLRVASSSGTSTLSGIMTHDNYSSSNFSPNVTGMTSYTIRIVPSTMQYEIVVDCPTYNDGDTFTANTAEGVEMTFKVISAADKTCQVGTGDYDTPPAISKSTTGNITIPKKIKGFNVVSIGKYAFKGCEKPTKIAIPTTIISIGYMGFEDCSSLTNIYIPSSVTSIGDYAFSGCSGLSSIEVDNGNTSFDSRNGCNAIINTSTNTLITGCKNTVIPNSVKSIGGHAFSGCTGLSNITIPESVTSIGDYAFVGCTNLATVLIPNSVTSLGGGVFRNCTSLTKVTLPETIYGIRFWLFLDCVNLIDIIIPNSVHYIGSGAFQGCNSLTNVTIPNNVSSVEEMAFQGCNSLESITISSSVTSIENEAFANCSQLRSVKSYITEPQNCSIHGYSFYNTSSNATLYVPTGTKSKYETTEGWNQFANIVETGSTTYSDGDTFAEVNVDGVTLNYQVVSAEEKTVKVIDSKYVDGQPNTSATNAATISIPAEVNGYAVVALEDCIFQSWQSLENVILPGTIMTLGNGTFHFCQNLQTINIPDGVKEIGGELFSGCTSLLSIVLPSSVETINSEAFENCSSLQNILIPDGVKTIGRESFRKCSSLTSITIPESVNLIKKAAFSGCTSLNSISVATGNTIYDSRENCNAIIETATNTLILANAATVIPSSVTKIGRKVFSGDIESIVIPSHVTVIGEDAFDGMTTMTSVTIPADVTEIGDCAFGDCIGLTSVTSLITEPFAIDESVFGREKYLDQPLSATLYIPVGTKAKYEATAGWNVFPNIVEMESADPSVFTSESENGVTMTFKITDEENKTCQIGTGASAAINTSTTGNVTLPKTVNGYTVTAIAANAFAGTGIGGVVIPNSIKSIGENAFKNCTSLYEPFSYIEEPFDIPESAFAGLPSSALLTILYGTKDKYLAAQGWNGFTEIYDDQAIVNSIHYSVNGAVPIEKGDPYTAWVESSAWNEYSGDVVIPESFMIGNESFTVVGIDNGAFYESRITSVTIPSTVRSINQQAFSSCSALLNVTSYIMEPKDESDAFVNLPTSATLYVPSGTKSLYEATAGWNQFSNIVEMMGEGSIFTEQNADGVPLTYKVTSIADKTVMLLRTSTWTNETLVGTLTIPNMVNGYTVTAIDKTVFRECKNLTSVKIPNTVTTIGRKCFDDSGLESIVIPASLTEIGERAFCDCRSLISLAVEEGNTVYYSNDNSNAIIEKATNKLLYGCKNTVIPESVKIIGARAFQRCSGLESIVIPEGVEQIEEMAFIECKNLKSITLPSTLTYIEMDAFSESPAISQITCSLTQPFNINTWVFASEKEENGNIVPNLAVYNNATLYVPSGTKVLYEAAEGWKLFKNIVEKEEEPEEIEVTDISQMDNVIYIESLKGCCGTTLDLPIKLNNTLTPTGCSFKLILPEGFSLAKDGGNLIYKMSTRTNSMFPVHSEADNGVYNFQLMPSSSTATVSGNGGIILTLELVVPEEASEGDYRIKLTNNFIQTNVNGSTNDTPLENVVTTLTIEDYIVGDVNGDKNVTPSDAIMILYDYFGLEQKNFNRKAAYVNSDEYITPSDAIEALYIYFRNNSKSNAPKLKIQTLDPQ